MKITEYPSASEILPDHKFLVDGPSGTQTVSGSLVLDNAGSGGGGGSLTDDPYITHRNNYRGMNLGDTYTAAQKTAISSGTFDDIYVGDYWEIDNVKYRVMDLDYFNSTTHHAVIMPDTALQQAVYQTGSTLNNIGYANASIRTSMSTSKTIINNAFGSANILEYDSWIPGSVSMDGVVNSATKVSATVELPNAGCLYGISYPVGNNGWVALLQYPLYQFSAISINPKLLITIQDYWLSDIETLNQVLIVNVSDKKPYSVVSMNESHNVRPVFAIK